MRPIVNKNSQVKKSKYKYPWYKSFIRLLRNQKTKDFKNEQTIHLS